MLSNYFVDIKELEARFVQLESLRKEAIKEFEEIFFYEMEKKKRDIIELSYGSSLEDKYLSKSLQKAYSLLRDTYWVYRKGVKELVEVFLFMDRTDYRFFKGEWYKAALRVEELQDEADKVFNLILAHHKREIRKELREVNLRFSFNSSSIALKRRKRDLEIELDHPSLTREELLANK